MRKHFYFLFCLCFFVVAQVILAITNFNDFTFLITYFGVYMAIFYVSFAVTYRKELRWWCLITTPLVISFLITFFWVWWLTDSPQIWFSFQVGLFALPIITLGVGFATVLFWQKGFNKILVKPEYCEVCTWKLRGSGFCPRCKVMT